ncbi:polysaccharide export protein [Geminicoccaceae bacterium 1502E]|nr:polysaccharide export protein [Geminicoccaceae bacterium 1502E]
MSILMIPFMAGAPRLPAPGFGLARDLCGLVARGAARVAVAVGLLAVAACSSLPEAPLVPENVTHAPSAEKYRIAPGDELSIFVWQDRDLSLKVRVRPDGRISMPLLEDVEAAGRTPSELGRQLEQGLSTYVQEPVVTVIVADFLGPLDQQVRVLGEATTPQSLSWRPDMSVLDALIAVGGLTEFADGNGAILVRRGDGEPVRYRVRLADLLRSGDVSANAALLPGDVLIIPETVF